MQRSQQRSNNMRPATIVQSFTGWPLVGLGDGKFIDVLHKDFTMLHHPRQRVSDACSSIQYTSMLAVPNKSLHVKSLRHAHHGVLAACTTQRVMFSTSMGKLALSVT